MAHTLNLSVLTIQRCLVCSWTNDSELDDVIKEIIKDFPNTFKVTENRIRNSFLHRGQNQSTIETITVNIRIAVKLENIFPQQLQLIDVTLPHHG